MAVITALFLASYSVGSGIGNTIAGAIWTNTMPGRLLNRLNENGVSNATAIANTVYADPLTFILTNPIGTPARTAVNDAYRDVQRYLTIAGICFSVIILLLTLGLANPVLGDRQNLEDAGSSTDSLNGSDAERITEAERAKESEAVKA
jgi:SIT family siderophore-iron:H+ symporter-like MFS transporter